MDDILYNKLLNDIKKWLLSNTNNRVEVGDKHSKVYYSYRDQTISCVNLKTKFNSIYFANYVRRCNIELYFEDNTIQQIFFRPFLYNYDNYKFVLSDNNIYDMRELYDKMKFGMLRNATSNHYYLIQVYFDRLPKLSSLQYVLDGINPYKQIDGEIIIEI